MFESYAESARRALFFAHVETSQFGAATIETEHLLLGLLHAARGPTRLILAKHGLASSEAARLDIESQAAPKTPSSTSTEIPFSDGTQHVLRFAEEEADRLGRSYIGTEHLLLALLRETDSIAASVLRKLQVLEAILTDLARPE